MSPSIRHPCLKDLSASQEQFASPPATVKHEMSGKGMSGTWKTAAAKAIINAY